MVIQYLGICTGFCLFQLNDTNVITAVVLVKLMLCGIHRISKNWLIVFILGMDSEEIPN